MRHPMSFRVVGGELQGGVAGGQRLLGLSPSEEELGTVHVVPDLEGLVRSWRMLASRSRSAASCWAGVMSLR